MLSTLLLPLLIQGANASSLTYTIQETKVSAGLALNFYQNATSMPNLNVTLTGTAAQDLTGALEESIRKKAVDISIISLTGGFTSASGWVNSTINFELAGASVRKGDLLVANCSWIPFNVTRDLRIEDLSYNLIGARYIRPRFAEYVNYTAAPLNETVSAVQYLSIGEEVPPLIAVDRAGNATLLDFRLIDQPIQNWKRTYNLTNDLTTWTYDPGLVLGLEMKVTPTEGLPSTFQASYSYNASISVKGSGQAHGDVITVDMYGGLMPLLMLVVVFVTFLAAIIASWTYRSRRRQMLLRKRR